MTRLPPQLFAFLGDLAAHNQREWFKANQDRYERDVREPMLAFIAALAPRLKRLSPRFVVDPARSGGSLMRIHRDTRFARDKSPYKTWVAAQFPHVAWWNDDQEAPGFYLHLAPAQSFMGAGLWHPQPDTLRKVRDAIVASPPRWRKATEKLRLDGEALARPPRGYDPSHPLVADLKRKDFITGAEFTARQVCAPDFVDRFVERCKQAAPLVRFLTAAVGFRF
jgi:uncharacterized protein (TIGR02453 family)